MRRPRDARYSSEMRASRMTLPMRACSSLICAPNSSAVPAMGNDASAMSLAVRSADLIAAAVSLLSKVMMLRGVPVGTTIPYHDPA